jgi:hypothetical protein
MRSLILACWFAAPLVGPAASGDTDADPKVVLAKAIQAHGGAEALAKHKAVRLKLTVTDARPNAYAFRREWLFAAPNKFKQVAEGFYLGRRTFSTYATDGKTTWSRVQGQTQELEGQFAEWFKDQAHLMQVMRLVPLQDKGYELKAAGTTKVDGKDAVGLLVRTRGQKDVTLYFDADTYLLVKVERRVYDTGTEKEATEEHFYQDYRRKDPLPYARKVVIKHDGKAMEYYEIREEKFLETAQDREFRP